MQPSPALPQPLFDNCAGGQHQDFFRWWEERCGQSFDQSRDYELLIQINSWDQCDFAEIVPDSHGRLLLIDSTMQADLALPLERDYQHRVYETSPDIVKAVLTRMMPEPALTDSCYAVYRRFPVPQSDCKALIIDFANHASDLEVDEDQIQPVHHETVDHLMLDVSAVILQYHQVIETHQQTQQTSTTPPNSGSSD